MSVPVVSRVSGEVETTLSKMAKPYLSGVSTTVSSETTRGLSLVRTSKRREFRKVRSSAPSVCWTLGMCCFPTTVQTVHDGPRRTLSIPSRKTLPDFLRG